MEWLSGGKITGTDKKALVIGCGLGDDAEVLAQHGFEVTAFDISATAVAWCKQRFPRSKVEYVVADILKPPQDWQEDFDFILEVYTLQVLPPDLRSQAITQIAQLLAPGGVLLLIARGRQPEDGQGTMPYPLIRGELAAFSRGGLKEVSFEDFMDKENPPVRRFRVEYHADA
jgi:SAM-dependent methyltransferase